MDELAKPGPNDAAERQSLLLDLDSGFSRSGIQHRRRAHYRRSVSWAIAIGVVAGVRRLVDVLLAAALLVSLSPLLLILLTWAYVSGGGMQQQFLLGRWGTTFSRYALSFGEGSRLQRYSLLRSFPALWNVLRGEMSFIGPRATAPDAIMRGQRAAWKRYDVRPGLLSLWWLRKHANIAYSSEAELDLEYVETNTLRGDVGIAVRALPVALFGPGVVSAPYELQFLGVRIHNLTMAEAAAEIVDLARSPQASQVCFVNADCVNIAFRNQAYRQTLREAKIVLADGIGVRIAGKVLHQHIRENVNGTDMLPYLCAAAESAGASIFLLGARPGVPDEAAGWMTSHYPRLRIAGSHHGYFSADEQSCVLQQIAASGADIVLVALGAPRQDTWVAEHLNELGVKVAIGVGGLLDFYAGRIPRAPVWLREVGLEWLYRFWQEPRRMWRRYFVGNAVFLFRVMRERLRHV